MFLKWGLYVIQMICLGGTGAKEERRGGDGEDKERFLQQLLNANETSQ